MASEPSLSPVRIVAATVGLDCGTTAIRASINMPGSLPESVSSPDIHDNTKRTTNENEFRAIADVTRAEIPPEYCIVSVNDYPDQISLKFGIYILYILEHLRQGGEARLETTMRQEIPAVNSFLNCFDRLKESQQVERKCTLERAFVAALAQVHYEIRMKAEESQCKITTIVATVPSTWNKWMQKYYTLLHEAASNVRQDRIVIMSESQAIANWVLSRSGTLRSFERRPKVLVMIDFGGHTLNISTYFLKPHYTDIEKLSFFSKGNDKCVLGGLERHASLVKERIHKDIESGHIDVTEEEERALYAGLMGNYRIEHQKKTNGRAFRIFTSPETGRTAEVNFDDEEAQHMYRTCILNTFGHIESELADVKNDGDREMTEVILTGGTFRNAYIRTAVEGVIEKMGFKLWGTERQRALAAQQSGNVAAGAAMAVMHAISVKEFVNRACFAVQDLKTISNNGRQFDKVIWSCGTPKTARVSLPGSRTGTFITCCPFPEAKDTLTVEGSAAYKLFKLPLLARSEYDVRMEYHEPENLDGTVRVHIEEAAGAHEVSKPKNYLLEFPIYYDCGARVCFEDIDKRMDPRKNPPRKCRGDRSAASNAEIDEGMSPESMAGIRKRLGLEARADEEESSAPLPSLPTPGPSSSNLREAEA